jgi:hypothetical protein
MPQKRQANNPRSNNVIPKNHGRSSRGGDTYAIPLENETPA